MHATTCNDLQRPATVCNDEDPPISTGNYSRSQFAEVLFNSVARKMGLAKQASSRGLAVDRNVNKR
jgi:hypothetical protein